MSYDQSDDGVNPNIPPDEQELVRTIMKRFTKLKACGEATNGLA
jgi:hypothetical protein